jgi:hypothetical protein
MNSTPAEKERREVTISLGGKVRLVGIRRTVGQAIWWCESPVVCRFKTGSKLHTKQWPIVREVRGQFEISSQVIHNRRATPVAWAEQVEGNSEWTNNSTADKA